MKYVFNFFVLLLFLVPSFALGAFTINTNEVTSSANITITAFNGGGEFGLYLIPDTLGANANWGMVAGTCGNQSNIRYECQTTVAPSAGNGINYHFGAGSGLLLGNGKYRMYSGSLNCGAPPVGSATCALTDMEVEFDVCPTLPCSSGGSASTSSFLFMSTSTDAQVLQLLILSKYLFLVGGSILVAILINHLLRK